jgi:hypothetical protein
MSLLQYCVVPVPGVQIVNCVLLVNPVQAPAVGRRDPVARENIK